jgi:hypothetical protein
MPWAISYLLPAEKWLPPCWPPYEWEVRQPPFQPMRRPQIPEGFAAPWWYYPKDQWPYQPVPWEPKIFGAFSARKVTMWPENLVNYPPFGNIKVKTPTHHPHSIGSIKVHTTPTPWLDVTPHPSVWAQGKFEEAMRQMSRKRPIKLVTDEGTMTIKSIRHANWKYKEDEYKEFRAAIKTKREAEHREMIAAEIVKTKGKPKESVDLFS